MVSWNESKRAWGCSDAVKREPGLKVKQDKIDIGDDVSLPAKKVPKVVDGDVTERRNAFAFSFEPMSIRCIELKSIPEHHVIFSHSLARHRCCNHEQLPRLS